MHRIHVSIRDVLHVREDECFVHVEAARDDVLRVFVRVVVCLIGFQLPPQELLVVGHLDDEGDIEDVLEPSKLRNKQSFVFSQLCEGVFCFSSEINVPLFIHFTSQ